MKLRFEIDRKDLLPLKSSDPRLYEVIMSLSTGDKDFASLLTQDDLEKIRKEVELGYFSLEDFANKNFITEYVSKMFYPDDVFPDTEIAERVDLDVVDQAKLVEHVKDNSNIDDVFEHDDIVGYVVDSCDVNVFGGNEILREVQNTCDISEVFTIDEIKDYAIRHLGMTEE